jgi:hypothetical protein
MHLGKIKKTLGIAGAAGAVAGAAYLSKSENREKVKKLVGLGDQSYVKKIGRPGAVGAKDDAKMVDEGALTSVQYYNKLQEAQSKEENQE